MPTLTAEQRLENVENRSDSLENVLERFIVSTNTALLGLDRSMKDFRKEMKEFKDEMKAFKSESERDRKEMNRKWGELANKMGTIVEDIVAPNIPRIVREYFDTPELDYFALRVRKKHSVVGSLKREFDIVAVSEKYLFINETKATPRPEYAREFRENLGEIFDFFPEYADRQIIPFFSSLSIPPDIQTYLSKNEIYALAMTDDTMEILNFKDVRKD